MKSSYGLIKVYRENRTFLHATVIIDFVNFLYSSLVSFENLRLSFLEMPATKMIRKCGSMAKFLTKALNQSTLFAIGKVGENQ